MNQKIRMNLTENLEQVIEMNNFKNLENKYKFYYDETNNIRKLRLKDNGTFNIKNEEVKNNFVLAGICHEEHIRLEDIDELINNLYLDKSNKEIKFKHVAKGTFTECLNSNKTITWGLE